MSVQTNSKGAMLNVSARGFEQIAESFHAAPIQIEKALKRAVARVTRWANTHLVRRVAAAVGVRVSIVKGRVRITIRDNSGRVWMGVNPISLRRLNPRQNKRGVKAGAHFIESGFIGGGRVAGHVMKRRGRERLPIDKQLLEIREDTEAVFQAVYSETLERFEKEFTHQIKWLTKN